MSVYVITTLILLFYIALAWFAGALLQLHGTALWLFRGGLIFIGVLAAGFFLWFHHRMKRAKSVTPSEFAALAEQVKVLLRQAEQKLVEGKQGSLRSLPIVFVLGDLNSAKTSSIVHCGLGPELIAGHVFSDGDIVPTATINVWFASKTVFIEAGGKVAANPHLWALVLRQTRPKRVPAAVGKGQQAPRAALVCLDCERLSSAQAPVQNLAARLKEMARSLGAPFPVYVLFTKMDRLPHFAEFVGNLTAEESAQVLGATLPRQATQGVFAEEESRRLAKALDQIIYSLAEKRLEYLGRETVSEKLPGIYEFPRELRKSRNQAVKLLVDLTSPTQLSANPFLRGFYFSGVRAILINEAVQVPSMARTAAVSGSGATRMFVIGEDIPGAAQNVPRRTVQSRKVPEWTFLSHLFTDVVLADRVAFAASHQSTRVDRVRQILFASVAVVFLFFAVALVVSFVKNRSFENQITRGAEHLNALSAGTAVETPTLEQLRQLEELRQMLATLGKYETAGPPLSYRFGLYAGDRIYPDAYSVYFQNFRRLLLATIQAQMVSVIGRPPATRTSEDFRQMYFTLKAYLITTRNHEHADWNDLITVLSDNSLAFKNADAESQDLIRRQLTFYAENLIVANPLSTEVDTVAVERARAYLKQFDAMEAIYQAMLDDAGKGKKPVNFNRQFPQSGGFVVDSYEVPAAFTKAGFAVMQKSLRNPEKLKGEEWVLGAPTALNISVESLRDQLTRRYWADYAGYWRAFLKAGRVVGFGGLKDASIKLSRLVANDSPLLQLLWLAKENTSVDIPELKDPFDAVQSTARDSTLERLVAGGNQEYMGALGDLQKNVQAVVNTPNGPTDPGMLGQLQQAASNAGGTVKRIEQHFTIDAAGGVDKNVGRLLEEPIEYTNDAAKRAAGAGAEQVCGLVNTVTSKRPFNLHSSQVASLQEVQDLFRPQQGNLWRSVQEKMGTAVSRQGSSWINIGQMPQSPGFLAFLNRAQQFTDALFPNGMPTIRLGYELRRLPTSGIEANLVIGGQTLDDSGRVQQLTWQGTENMVSLSVTVAVTRERTKPVLFQGPWALFEFFSSAEWAGNNPATLGYALQSKVELAHHQVDNGSAQTVEYQLTTPGAPVFSRDFLRGLHCSAR
ncbi:MAG TPA: ImcF-related family protein [Candidatus Angelobacter sp.]|nr:ImcF-related family protein [Candidatus Angelobacter sp.]